MDLGGKKAEMKMPWLYLAKEEKFPQTFPEGRIISVIADWQVRKMNWEYEDICQVLMCEGRKERRKWEGRKSKCQTALWVLQKNKHYVTTQRYLWHMDLPQESQEAFLWAQGKFTIYIKKSTLWNLMVNISKNYLIKK